MSVWRVIAATAALCCLAQSMSVAAERRPHDGAVPKHKLSRHDPQSHHFAGHRKQHRYATHRKTHRYASRRKVHHIATRFDTFGYGERRAREIAGTASYYSKGARVASGGRFDPNGFTCAHRTLPFGTRLRVIDMLTRRTVDVTVNDRGPFVRGRVLDLSRGAAQALGMTGRGVTRIKASVI
jgi:peptidoglycan lytic transglycosylase